MGSGSNLRIAAKLFALLIVLFLISLSTACANITLLESPGCVKCAAAKKVINDVLAQEPNLTLVSFYYYTDEGHRIIKEKKIKGDIPAIIIGDSVIGYKDYNGDQEKLHRLIMLALANQSASENVSPVSSIKNNNINQGVTGSHIENGSEVDLSNLTYSSIFAVFFFGLLAGFNPCLLGILIFLAASVISGSGRRSEMLILVLSFSLGIFVTYLLFGLGMQRILQVDAVAPAFRYILTIFLVVIGLANLEDARRLSHGGESIFRTDWALKYVYAGVSRRKISSYFLIGSLFSLVKAPCVGAVYLAILDVLSARSYLEGSIYLIFYNLGIVLPILILGGFIALGTSPEQVDKFRKDYRAGIRLITGLTLLILAPLIYWQII
jgi:cytochrome c-type biogenesis protein